MICPDNRGMGESELGDPAEMTAASLAGDCLALLDHLGIEHAAVLGWSMGGFVAQQLAALASGRVSALVLLATDPGGPGAKLADPATSAGPTTAAAPRVSRRAGSIAQSPGYCRADRHQGRRGARRRRPPALDSARHRAPAGASASAPRTAAGGVRLPRSPPLDLVAAGEEDVVDQTEKTGSGRNEQMRRRPTALFYWARNELRGHTPDEKLPEDSRGHDRRQNASARRKHPAR